MPTNVWTRQQQVIALRLYMRTPFGRLHGKNPDIIELSAKIGRTPGALAMKACNFASLDPAFRATQRTGLTGASGADRALWDEFSGNTEKFALEVEEAFDALDLPPKDSSEDDFRFPATPTDAIRSVRVRRVQGFFRAAVLTSYEGKCAVTGLASWDLLVASHIIPWAASKERRADPRNGICLGALFDRAFDRGLITFDETLKVVVSKRLLNEASKAALTNSIAEAHGRPINKPTRFAPDQSALEHHRNHIFVD